MNRNEQPPTRRGLPIKWIAKPPKHSPKYSGGFCYIELLTKKQGIFLADTAFLFQHQASCGKQRFAVAAGILRANGDTAHTGNTDFGICL